MRILEETKSSHGTENPPIKIELLKSTWLETTGWKIQVSVGTQACRMVRNKLFGMGIWICYYLQIKAGTILEFTLQWKHKILSLIKVEFGAFGTSQNKENSCRFIQELHPMLSVYLLYFNKNHIVVESCLTFGPIFLLKLKACLLFSFSKTIPTTLDTRFPLPAFFFHFIFL